MKKTPFILFVVCATSMFYGCGKKEITDRPEPTVVVAQARYAEIAPTALIIGQAKANKSVDFTARVKGFLLKRNFKEGDYVKKGALLFEIEPYEYEANVQKAEAGVGRANANLKNASLDYDRQRSLVAQNVVSKREYDRAEANKGKYEAELLDAQAVLKLAKLNLSYTKIHAPFDGIVGLVSQNVGNMVYPVSGKLANIAQVDPIRVEFSLSETLLLELFRQNNYQVKNKDDQTVYVELIFQDGSIYNQRGRIAYKDNQINPTTGTILLQAVFENKTKMIVPGMYVKVRLIQKEKVRALMIPRRAVQEDLSGKYVMLVSSQSVVERRDIKTGLTSGADIQVLKGLKDDDRIVIEGIMKIRQGIKVKTILDTDKKAQARPETNAGEKKK